MNSKNIVIGESYRHKNHPSYAYAKVLEVLQPRTGINTTNKILAKCQYSVHYERVGRILYFQLNDLIKDK
jgi:hypothetical protein